MLVEISANYEQEIVLLTSLSKLSKCQTEIGFNFIITKYFTLKIIRSVTFAELRTTKGLVNSISEPRTETAMTRRRRPVEFGGIQFRNATTVDAPPPPKTKIYAVVFRLDIKGGK